MCRHVNEAGTHISRYQIRIDLKMTLPSLRDRSYFEDILPTRVNHPAGVLREDRPHNHLLEDPSTRCNLSCPVGDSKVYKLPFSNILVPVLPANGLFQDQALSPL